MSRLIDADALYKRIAIREEQLEKAILKFDPIKNHEAWITANGELMERMSFRHEIMDAPTIEERKTGKWIDETFKSWGLVYHPYKCDQCGVHSEADSNYCPSCGARMEVEDE